MFKKIAILTVAAIGIVAYLDEPAYSASDNDLAAAATLATMKYICKIDVPDEIIDMSGDRIMRTYDLDIDTAVDLVTAEVMRGVKMMRQNGTLETFCRGAYDLRTSMR